MMRKLWDFPLWFVFCVAFCVWCLCGHGLVVAKEEAEDFPSFGPLITKESRRIITSTESGVISAIDVHDGYKGPFHLQFISLEPSSLFLPVLLHADMVFYVHTGKGTVSWVGDHGTNQLEVKRGDVYGLEQGSVLYIKSHPDPTREKLRIHAMFNTITSDYPPENFVGAYSNITDLVRGFDERVLQIGFGVSEEVIQRIKWVEKPPSIIPFKPRNESEKPNWEARVLEALIWGRPFGIISGNKKKTKTRTFNIFHEKPDVENCNGWSTAVTDKNLKALKGTNIGVFMANLSKGAMMGPHWNPKASEIATVLQGQGMVQVVCPSNPSRAGTFTCQNSRFRVKEGDTFVVPRFHPMAQISFNNDSFVFMGFSTRARNNHPQFLAGKRSVLQVIDREILEMSFNAANTTLEDLLVSQDESIILECASCAEQVEKKMEEEIERQKQEEEAKKREEERKREEEEARRREEARKRAEEAREREEERKREEEAARRQEEEEARKREEARRQKEEAAARKREEEEARRQKEEARRQHEVEEARKRAEEEARKREAAARRQEEEEARKREEARRQKEEAAARKREEEEARRQKEEARRQHEVEEARKRAEEEARKREAAARRQEEEEARKREEARRREEEAAARKREEEKARRQREGEKARRQEEKEEVRRRQEEEEEARREEEIWRWEEEEEEARRRREQEHETRRKEGEARRRQEKEEGGHKRAEKRNRKENLEVEKQPQ